MQNSYKLKILIEKTLIFSDPESVVFILISKIFPEVQQKV